MTDTMTEAEARAAWLRPPSGVDAEATFYNVSIASGGASGSWILSGDEVRTLLDLLDRGQSARLWVDVEASSTGSGIYLHPRAGSVSVTVRPIEQMPIDRAGRPVADPSKAEIMAHPAYFRAVLTAVPWDSSDVRKASPSEINGTPAAFHGPPGATIDATDDGPAD